MMIHSRFASLIASAGILMAGMAVAATGTASATTNCDTYSTAAQVTLWQDTNCGGNHISLGDTGTTSQTQFPNQVNNMSSTYGSSWAPGGSNALSSVMIPASAVAKHPRGVQIMVCKSTSLNAPCITLTNASHSARSWWNLTSWSGYNDGVWSFLATDIP